MKKSKPRTLRICAAIPHSWEPHDGANNGSTVRVDLQCSRCGTIWHRVIRLKDMKVLKKSYTYQPGYLVQGGRLTKDEKAQIMRHHMSFLMGGTE